MLHNCLLPVRRHATILWDSGEQIYWAHGNKLIHRNFNQNRTGWRHQMETFSALLALCAGNSPVTGEFPSQRPVTRSFDVFFDLRLNKRLSKQWWGWWFETPSPHYYVTVMKIFHYRNEFENVCFNMIVIFILTMCSELTLKLSWHFKGTLIIIPLNEKTLPLNVKTLLQVFYLYLLITKSRVLSWSFSSLLTPYRFS